MSHVAELLSGLLRFFPNTMLVTLFVVGIALGKISWVLVSIGGIVVTIFTVLIQYMALKALGLGVMPGVAVMEACSLIPIANGGYSSVPSLWVALSSFFVTYVIVNAANIYNATPVRVSKEAISVQQRKGIGLISMLAASILFVFLMIPRYWTSCETLIGIITGLVVGVGGGVVWWNILDACGPDLYPDIHSVMIGLKPGGITLACKTQS